MTSGVTLHREIKQYLNRTGTSAQGFTRAAGLPDSMVCNMLRTSFPREATVAKVRSFIAEHPNGLGDMEPVSHAGGQQHGAAALERARRVSTAAARPAAMTIRETVASALVETPGDLVATVKRQWPDVWAGVLNAARAQAVSPAQMLVTAIERGLEVEA